MFLTYFDKFEREMERKTTPKAQKSKPHQKPIKTNVNLSYSSPGFIVNLMIFSLYYLFKHIIIVIYFCIY